MVYSEQKEDGTLDSKNLIREVRNGDDVEKIYTEKRNPQEVVAECFQKKALLLNRQRVE